MRPKRCQDCLTLQLAESSFFKRLELERLAFGFRQKLDLNFGRPRRKHLGLFLQLGCLVLGILCLVVFSKACFVMSPCASLCKGRCSCRCQCRQRRRRHPCRRRCRRAACSNLGQRKRTHAKRTQTIWHFTAPVVDNGSNFSFASLHQANLPARFCGRSILGP